MADSREISVVPMEGGTSVLLTLAANTSQQYTPAAAVAGQALYITLFADVDCFIRQGANPTALADGADQILPANNMYRIGPIAPGNRLAIISASVGSVYITPHA
jgi:hypothetical protein